LIIFISRSQLLALNNLSQAKIRLKSQAELRKLLILLGITFLPLFNLPQQSLILDYEITSSDSFLLRDDFFRDIFFV